MGGGRTGEDFEEVRAIRSVADMLEALRAHPYERPWYRGQANAKHGLIPGAFRTTSLREAEQRMLDEFKQYALLFSNHQPQDEWGWKVLAQHYGIPTRLLDWTTSSLQALFFAAQDEMDDRGSESLDGRLFVLDYGKLNEKACGHGWRDPLVLQEGRLDEWAGASGRPKRGRCLPVAVVAVDDFLRIGAQRGTFTLFSDDDTVDYEELADGSNDICLTYRIPADAKQEIRRDLELCSVNRATTCVDLDSLARLIRERHMQER